MSLRLTLAASAVLLGTVALSAPAFAIEQIHIPDPSAAPSSAPPDALFDSSIPTTWQKKSDSNQQSNGLGGFHFSVTGNNGYSNYNGYSAGQVNGSNFGENANAPMSEFHTNGQALPSPYFPLPQ